MRHSSWIYKESHFSHLNMSLMWEVWLHVHLYLGFLEAYASLFFLGQCEPNLLHLNHVL